MADWLNDYEGVITQDLQDIEIPMADLRRFVRSARALEEVRRWWGFYGDSVEAVIGKRQSAKIRASLAGEGR